MISQNRQAANKYMDKVSQESEFTSLHKGFTKVPHKIHRCYGLSQYEKLILIDLIAYMSDKAQCYPTHEMIARNVGSSSNIMQKLDFKLNAFTGIDNVTASAIVAEIGDISPFTSADKLAKYARLTPSCNRQVLLSRFR